MGTERQAQSYNLYNYYASTRCSKYLDTSGRYYTTMHHVLDNLLHWLTINGCLAFT